MGFVHDKKVFTYAVYTLIHSIGHGLVVSFKGLNSDIPLFAAIFLYYIHFAVVFILYSFGYIFIFYSFESEYNKT